MNTTVNNSSTTSSNPINELIAKVMDKFDTNKDKQLSATEFSSFLGGLLNGATNLAGATTLGTTDTPGVDTPVGGNTPFAPTTANWSVMHGFASANYYNPDMNSMKYKFARIAADYDPRQPGAAERLVADPRFAAAFPNAKLVGKDSIDFGGQLSDGPGKGVPVGIVDIGEAFTDNCCGVAWQWLDEGIPTALSATT